MELEDNYEDIIKKAERGLNKKISGRDINNLARELNLNANALKRIKNGKYKPREFDYNETYDGLRIAKISSPLISGYVNAYIVIDENENCVIIDTAQSPDKIIRFVKKERLNAPLILITHEHHDHIEGMDRIQEETDAYNLDFEDLKDCPAIQFGKRAIEVFRTPGHSEESLTYRIGRFLFVGDLMFAGSLGGGSYSYEKLLESARMILKFSDDYFIFPGHGPATTVKEEKENNAFIV